MSAIDELFAGLSTECPWHKENGLCAVDRCDYHRQQPLCEAEGCAVLYWVTNVLGMADANDGIPRRIKGKGGRI